MVGQGGQGGRSRWPLLAAAHAATHDSRSRSPPHWLRAALWAREERPRCLDAEEERGCGGALVPPCCRPLLRLGSWGGGPAAGSLVPPLIPLPWSLRCLGGARALEPGAAVGSTDDASLSDVVGAYLRRFLREAFPRLGEVRIEAEWTVRPLVRGLRSCVFAGCNPIYPIYLPGLQTHVSRACSASRATRSHSWGGCAPTFSLASASAGTVCRSVRASARRSLRWWVVPTMPRFTRLCGARQMWGGSWPDSYDLFHSSMRQSVNALPLLFLSASSFLPSRDPQMVEFTLRGVFS